MSMKNNIFQIVKNSYIEYRLIRSHFKKNIPKLPPKIKPRILIIASDNNKISGAFLCMTSLAEILINKYDLDVTIILPNFGSGTSLLKSKNIPYFHINSFNWVDSLDRPIDEKFKSEVKKKKIVNEKAIELLQEFIQKNNIDLIHINTTYSYVGAIAALNENIPFIWHIREFLEEDQNNTLWDRIKGNEIINKSNKVITISNSVYEKYRKIIDSDKLLMIHDGIESKFYNPNKHIMDSEKIRIIFVGGISESKGIFDFIKACSNVLYKQYDIEAWIIGTGKKEVINKAKSFIPKSQQNKFKFLGYQKSVETYLEKTDIFCMCSQSEAFGRTTVEAMLSGNLVIGTNIGGTKDLIINNENGLLYKANDVEDLTRTIINAIEHKIESKKIAENGQKYMNENMTAESNASKIYEVYSQILK